MTNPAYRVIVSDGVATQTTLVFTASTTWTVPADWNSGANMIEGIGGGGGGGFYYGGGGGAYAKIGNISLTPGASIPIVIGAGGTNGGNGGNTTFNTTTLVVHGGGGGNGAVPGLGGQASLCVPSSSAFNGGNGGLGSSTLGATVFYTGASGGGGGGAAGPGYNGQNGGGGNAFIGGGGGGGAGGSASTSGQSGQITQGSRIGGTGGAGPLGIGSGNGNVGAGGTGLFGAGGGGAGQGNIAVVYSVGTGGVSMQNGGSTTITVLGFTVTAQGGVAQTGGTATTTITGTARTTQGGNGGAADTATNIYECGGGGGINASPGFNTGTGGQSIDFNGLRSVVENLGYSWTGPGVLNNPNPGTNATGFGCGGGGGVYNFPGFGASSGSAGGNGLWGGGGGGGGRGLPGGTGGSGAVVIQAVTLTSTTNTLVTGNGVYIPPANLTSLKIWVIGGGAGGITSSGAQPGGGAGGLAYVEIIGNLNGSAGGQGGTGTLSANGWSSNGVFYGPGGGGGGASLPGTVTDISGSPGAPGAGGLYGAGSGGGNPTTYVSGASGLLVITYQPFVQTSTTIDVDDLLVLKSSVIPSNLFSSGNNTYGQLGLNISDLILPSTSSPIQLGGNNQWMSIAAGYNNSSAITGNGNLFVWGTNASGQLGLGLPTVSNLSSPTQVGTGSWRQIIWSKGANFVFSLGLTTNGNILASGSNANYGLGNGTTANSLSFVPISGPNGNWRWISATWSAGLAINNQDLLWGWGDTSIAWTSATLSASTPVQLGSSTWQSVQGGFNHAMALTKFNDLYSWGFNSQGQLGLGDITQRSTPVQVTASNNTSGWRSVACGAFFTLAIAGNGTLWAWGQNSNGQLGLGDTTRRLTPVQVGSLTTWQWIACGEASSLALKSDGTLWTWGRNTFGTLGLNSATAEFSSPVQVGSNINWKTAEMGQYHMLAAAYPYL